MSETIERYGIEINAKVEKALQALARLESQNKKTKETLEKTQKAGTDSANALGGAFDNLKGKLLGLLAVGAFTSFIKKLAESNLQIKIMADRLGMTAKNVKGMQQAFKSVGQDESLANASMEEYNKSYAVAKYKGQLTGSVLTGAKLGVSANDARGNQKDVVDFQAEIGQTAVRKLGGRNNAIQWLTSEGMDPNLASMITRADYREFIRLKQEEAVVSDKAAEAARKLAESTEKLNNRMAEIIVTLDEEIGLFDGLNTVLDATPDIVTAVISIMRELGGVFSTFGKICEGVIDFIKPALEGIAKLLPQDESGNYLQSLAGEGFSFDVPETHQPAGLGSGGSVSGGGSGLFNAWSRANVQNESGKTGGVGKNGKPLLNLNSGKGFGRYNGTYDVGMYQLNETNGPYAAKLAGVAWDRTRFFNDVGYANMLGRAYQKNAFDTAMSKYHDPLKAFAYYHSPKAMQDANRYGSGWLEYLRQKWPLVYKSTMNKGRIMQAGLGGGNLRNRLAMFDGGASSSRGSRGFAGGNIINNFNVASAEAAAQVAHHVSKASYMSGGYVA